MYPMALMNLSPLSPPCLATLPHELVLSGYPAVPNPIRESLDVQAFSLLPTIPIRALEAPALTLRTLKPSFWQLFFKEAPVINFFHSSRPREVLRYLPSAIRAYSELAFWFKTKNLVTSPTFKPRQILVKGVFQ